MNVMTTQAIRWLGVAALLAGWCAVLAAETEFDRVEREWRESRAKRITSPNGWLTLVGLAWLQPGENTLGSDPASEVRLPEGKAPAHAGTLVLADGKVTIKPAPNSGLTLNGAPVEERVLGDDMSDATDVLKTGDVTFFVIRRGDRFGVRIKDPASPARTGFRGLEYFPAAARWRVTGKFVPYDKPKQVPIPTVLGTTDMMDAPGVVKFTLDGHDYSLAPVIEDPKDPSLFFIFKDETSGKETYGAGRFMYSEMPNDGKVVLDFNQAYNPPCAFTPYATCPLPPKENWLPFRVDAGEKAYAGGHEAHSGGAGGGR